MESAPYPWSDDVNGLFADWIRNRFETGTKALNHLAIISSFSSDESNAFENYFELLEEYCTTYSGSPNIVGGLVQKLSFADLLKALRASPERYLGSSTFIGSCAFLMGESRAHRDLKLGDEEARKIFDSFRSWIEQQKNRAKPRPWFRIIQFRSGGADCGHTKRGALTLFFDWLDEYAIEMNRPGLFRPDFLM